LFIVGVNKEESLLNWIKNFNDEIKLNWLSNSENSFAIVPIGGEEVIEAYIDGSNLKKYDFYVQIMLEISKNDDDKNTENSQKIREFQEWIEERNELNDYPDFGVNCFDYELINLSDISQVAQIYENGFAKYQIPVRIKYCINSI